MPAARLGMGRSLFCVVAAVVLRCEGDDVQIYCRITLQTRETVEQQGCLRAGSEKRQVVSQRRQGGVIAAAVVCRRCELASHLQPTQWVIRRWDPCTSGDNASRSLATAS